jgi:hypothetical protein
MPSAVSTLAYRPKEKPLSRPVGITKGVAAKGSSWIATFFGNESSGTAPVRRYPAAYFCPQSLLQPYVPPDILFLCRVRLARKHSRARDGLQLLKNAE